MLVVASTAMGCLSATMYAETMQVRGTVIVFPGSLDTVLTRINEFLPTRTLAVPR